MSSQIGPEMPAHLTKRKRTPDDDGEDNRRVRLASPATTTKTTTIGPIGPSAPPPAVKATLGPSLPPQTSVNEDEIALDDDSDDNSDTGPAPPPIAKPAARPVMGPTMGPTMPPPDTDLRDSRRGGRDRRARSESKSGSDSGSDSEDSDYGPALPGQDDERRHAAAAEQVNKEEEDAPGPSSFDPYSAAPAQRDDWMLAPPTDQTAASRAADPTKIRSRGFATGRAAAAGEGRAAGGSGGAASSAIGSLWTETLQQKSQRLADTVLGRAPDPRQGRSAAAAAAPTVAMSPAEAAANAAREAQIRAYTESTRGKSLYDAHQESLKGGKSTKDKNRDDKKNRDRERERDRDHKRHPDGDRENKDRERRHDRHDRHDRDHPNRHNHRDREDKDEFEGEVRSTKPTEEDDDPSARAFDREKDMRIGVQINNKQRRDLVSRAGDFGGRFSKGSFL
ncbi:hypothetical protein Sste5346_000232 [Sporothrix stenoceras]|uniref:DUF3752 domain-containing protein n=1 Tax=Sporothrix stenoceras TaxID=5173 RepID=A0ABR3ZSD8_9PEZI